MLVLTRKKSQVIHIGDDIVVKVVQVSRGIVKIGIEAPKHVRVRRAEIEEEDRAIRRPEPKNEECWVMAPPAGAGMSC